MIVLFSIYNKYYIIDIYNKYVKVYNKYIKNYKYIKNNKYTKTCKKLDDLGVK